MKLAYLDLSPELFIGFLQASKDGPPRRFRVKQNPLPDDAEVEGVIVAKDRYPLVLRLVIKSESFADIPEGDLIPELPCILYETVFDEAGQLVA